jgi:hypothetical protein
MARGAFRRFKDVLMSFAPERERWFAFRSERLRIFMEAWLSAHALSPVPRPMWVPEAAPALAPGAPPSTPPAAGVAAPLPIEAPREEAREPRRGKSVETLRRNLREIADALGPRDLDTLTAFAEFLKAKRAARSLGAHPGRASRERRGRVSVVARARQRRAQRQRLISLERAPRYFFTTAITTLARALR